jgi:hypothetical protein
MKRRAFITHFGGIVASWLPIARAASEDDSNGAT